MADKRCLATDKESLDYRTNVLSTEDPKKDAIAPEATSFVDLSAGKEKSKRFLCQCGESGTECLWIQTIGTDMIGHCQIW